MGMKRPPQESPEFTDALIKLEQAKSTQKKAQKTAGEARTKHDRVRSMYERARAQQADAQKDEADARRMVSEAQYKADDARRKGMPSHRWEAEARRWMAEGRRMADDSIRWGEDARRKEREVRSSHEELRGLDAELGDVIKAASKLEQRLKFISQSSGGKRPSGQPSERGGEGSSLAVTEDATATLSQILDNTVHRPNQVLRLNADSEGNVKFTLDTATEDDSVVTHEGSVVMIIESPLPESLQGTTLDVERTPSGPTLILSR